MKKQLITVLVIALLCGLKTQGQGYWQQKVDYTIDVRLDDKNHVLNADLALVYHNQSPDTLSEIWMHLYPNAYSTQFTALAKQLIMNKKYAFSTASDSSYGYIDSLDFKVNGINVPFAFNQPDVDIGKITLLQPLFPGDSIRITTPFRVKIPASFSRLGHVGESYQITQWYPKPAVYDKNGWHEMPYLDQGEFYSEYGTFDVKITLPANYVVGATGDLQNADELAFLNQLAEKTSKMDSFDTSDIKFPVSADVYKVLQYKQKNVHDFAWFADKRFNVLKGEVTLPNTQRKVTTWVMFTNAYANYWKKSIEYINDATYYYSLWNGDYLYNQVTAVDGALSAGGGMEYPNVTVIGAVGSDRTLEQVIMHEVGHNWFYGMLGSNERAHGWMDEGINTFNETRYMKTKYPKQTLNDELGVNVGISLFGINDIEAPATMNLGYKLFGRSNIDQAIETPSADFTSSNYGIVMYGKTGLVFEYLRNYLGLTLFDACMQTYFKEWNCKHPQPEDMRNVFERVSGQDLRWFFYDVLESKSLINHSIKKVKQKEDTFTFYTRNRGTIPTAAVLTLYLKDSIVDRIPVPPYLKTSSVSTSSAFDRAALNPDGQVPELYFARNYYHKKGLLKTNRPWTIKPLFHIEDAKRQYAFVSPAIGYNYYDGFQAGIALYNHLLPEKKFEWDMVGLYAFNSKQFNSTGSAQYHIYPRTSNTFQRITIGTGMRNFSDATTANDHIFSSGVLNYHRVFVLRNFLNIDFKSPIHSSLKRALTFKVNTIQASSTESIPTILPALSYSVSTETRQFISVVWNQSNSFRYYTTQWSIMAEQFESRVKLAAEYHINPLMYNRKERAEFRVYAGFIAPDNGGINQAYNQLYLSNSFDYTYQRTLAERTGKFSNSFNPIDKILVSADAGFVGDAKAPAIVSNTFVSANAWLPLPKMPFVVFVNQALDGQAIYYAEAGLGIPFFKGNMKLLVPIVNNLNQKEIHLADTYSFRIAFNIESLNPLQLVKRISF